MLKICLLIYKLDYGGAQRQIVTLAKALAEAGHDVTLMSCYAGGVFADELRSFDKVGYISLNKKGRWDLFGFLFRFLLRIKKLQPDILYGFLSLANLVSVFSKLVLPGIKVVWGVRASNMDLQKYGLSSRIAFRLECSLSRFADCVIANSAAGKAYHSRFFSFPGEIIVIQNGIDTDRFKPEPEKRIKQRLAWKVSDNTFLIGTAGRMDPMKGYPVFIRAAAIISQKYPNIRFVCSGDGPEIYVQELKLLAKELGISDRIIWAGFNREMSGVYNGLDIFTSASVFGEGFSNAVAEAMASGLPCVVTDVGDAAVIAGDTGRVIPPSDPEALAFAWEAILKDEGTAKPGDKERKRIVENFSIKQLLEKTGKALTA